MKILYQCDFCMQIYNSEANAKHCENRPNKEHAYKVGEEVYFLVRYPEDKNIPYAKRSIKTLLYDKDHKPIYELNESVQIGKSLCVGVDTPAEEEDIYTLNTITVNLINPEE